MAIAKGAGFSISADDLTNRQKISDEELEGAAGGALGNRDCSLMCAGCNDTYVWPSSKVYS